MFACLTITAAAPQAAIGQFDTYEPYVAVDIGQYIDDAESITVEAGEAMDVNNDGFVVGWYEDNGDTLPFVLDPTDGGALMVINSEYEYSSTTYTFEEAEMVAISNATSLGDVVIAGWISDDDAGPSGSEPAFWTWNSGSSKWDTYLVAEMDNWSRVVGAAHDVNVDGDLAGYFVDSGTDTVLYYDFDNDDAVDWGDGVGYGINDNGLVVGDTLLDQGFVQWGSNPGNDRQTLVANPNDDTLARAINNDDHVVGGAGASSSAMSPWVWWYDDVGDDWEDHEEIDVLESTYTSAIAEDINDADATAGDYEMVGNYETPTSLDGGYYVAAPSGVTWDSEDLETMAKFPTRGLSNMLAATPDPVMDKTYRLNDNGWIAGSFRADESESDYRPCVIVPNDVNNNQTPDIFEILAGDEDDENGNWLLDWGENDPDNTDTYMRPGVHGAGVDGKAIRQNVDHIQMARFILSYRRPGTTGDPDLEGADYGIENIVNGDDAASGGTLCENFAEQLEFWARHRDNETSGTHDADNDIEREIVTTLRYKDDSDGTRDVIPTGSDRTDAVIYLSEYAYRFSRCIDYIQFGNESFQGSGELFYDNSLIGGKTGQNLVNATTALLDWIQEQTEVARTASALSGRPLRFIGPGFSGEVVRAGYDGDPQWDPQTCAVTCLSSNEDRSAYAVQETNKLLNAERMYFDLHVHYKEVAWAIGGGSYSEGVVEMPADDSSEGWTGYGADALIALEWGPKAATNEDPLGETADLDDWWKGQNGIPRENGDEFPYYLSEETTDPHREWESFLNEDNVAQDPGWEFAQFGGDNDGDGFQMYDIVDDLEANGYLGACYGPVWQDMDLLNAFNIAALNASLITTQGTIIPDPPSDDYIIDDDRWTYMRDYFEEAVDEHEISTASFEPHVLACDTSVTCPDN